jgi:hypothetical protein
MELRLPESSRGSKSNKSSKKHQTGAISGSSTTKSTKVFGANYKGKALQSTVSTTNVKKQMFLLDTVQTQKPLVSEYKKSIYCSHRIVANAEAARYTALRPRPLCLAQSELVAHYKADNVASTIQASPDQRRGQSHS